MKTSILILDKALANQSATIGFFKIANDGFGLGTQRRATEKNDIPQALAEMIEYGWRLRTREPLGGLRAETRASGAKGKDRSVGRLQPQRGAVPRERGITHGLPARSR